MNSIKNVKKQIDSIITILVETNMSVHQNFPVIKEYKNNVSKIEWSEVKNLSISLKNIEYEKMYNELYKNEDYTIQLIDGCLLQLQYTFKDEELHSHRLAMFPSSKLYNFEDEPELYCEDEIYADIVDRKLLKFPIRFDYSADAVESVFEHPLSHATLGQYKNCRIPVYGPLSPNVFISFVLKNFYNTYYNKIFANKNKITECKKIESIVESEKNDLHFNIG